MVFIWYFNGIYLGGKSEVGWMMSEIICPLIWIIRKIIVPLQSEIRDVRQQPLRLTRTISSCEDASHVAVRYLDSSAPALSLVHYHL